MKSELKLSLKSQVEDFYESSGNNVQKCKINTGKGGEHKGDESDSEARDIKEDGDENSAVHKKTGTLRPPAKHWVSLNTDTLLAAIKNFRVFCQRGVIGTSKKKTPGVCCAITVWVSGRTGNDRPQVIFCTP